MKKDSFPLFGINLALGPHKSTLTMSPAQGPKQISFVRVLIFKVINGSPNKIDEPTDGGNRSSGRGRKNNHCEQDGIVRIIDFLMCFCPPNNDQAKEYGQKKRWKYMFSTEGWHLPTLALA